MIQLVRPNRSSSAIHRLFRPLRLFHSQLIPDVYGDRLLNFCGLLVVLTVASFIYE